MNNDSQKVQAVLLDLRKEYEKWAQGDSPDPQSPITERDIVAEIYGRLKAIFNKPGMHIHCEIKPVRASDKSSKKLRKLPRIDVCVLKDIGKRRWIDSAIKIQEKYAKGNIEARFPAVPIEYIHTAIEVKIQSKPDDAHQDFKTLKKLQAGNTLCNCFFVLLNARGLRQDHDRIVKYAQKYGITAIEFTKN